MVHALSLAKTRLTADAPVVAEKVTRPRFTREVVQLKWRLTDPIHCFIVRPVGTEKPPVVLYLYGYPADMQRFMDDGYCERVTRNGCAAIGFECALSGERYRMRPMREWFVSELQEALASTAHDVQYVLNYLQTRRDLDMSRVGLFGQGSGGSVAILTAAADPRIQAIDLLAPWGDWKDWMAKSSLVPNNERSRYLQPDFQKRAATLEPMQWLSRLKKTKIRLQSMDWDTITPPVCQNKLIQAVPPNTKIARFAHPRDAYVAWANGSNFAWIGRQLGAKPQFTPIFEGNTPVRPSSSPTHNP